MICKYSKIEFVFYFEYSPISIKSEIGAWSPLVRLFYKCKPKFQAKHLHFRHFAFIIISFIIWRGVEYATLNIISTEAGTQPKVVCCQLPRRYAAPPRWSIIYWEERRLKAHKNRIVDPPRIEIENSVIERSDRYSDADQWLQWKWPPLEKILCTYCIHRKSAIVSLSW